MEESTPEVSISSYHRQRKPIYRMGLALQKKQKIIASLRLVITSLVLCWEGGVIPSDVLSLLANSTPLWPMVPFVDKPLPAITRIA